MTTTIGIRTSNGLVDIIYTKGVITVHHNGTYKTITVHLRPDYEMEDVECAREYNTSTAPYVHKYYNVVDCSTYEENPEETPEEDEEDELTQEYTDRLTEMEEKECADIHGILSHFDLPEDCEQAVRALVYDLISSKGKTQKGINTILRKEDGHIFWEDAVAFLLKYDNLYSLGQELGYLEMLGSKRPYFKFFSETNYVKGAGK